MNTILPPELGMSEVFRFPGIRTIKPQSVGEHSYRMAMLAIRFSDDLKYNGLVVDTNDLVTRCIIHDYPERYTNDIPRPFKYRSETFHELMTSLERECLGDSQFEQSRIEQILKCKDFDSAEGFLCHYLDNYECSLYVYQELKLGNRLLYEEYKDGMSTLTKFAEGSRKAYPDWLEDKPKSYLSKKSFQLLTLLKEAYDC